MATLTIELNTGAGTLSVTKTLSGADLTKLLNAFTTILIEQGIASPTQQECFNYWVSRWIADTITVIRNQNRIEAESSISNIVIS
jgi:hypothetical protein